MRQRDSLPPGNPDRRTFLAQCCKAGMAGLVPASLKGIKLPFGYFADTTQALSRNSEFHLHPHYRSELPIESVLQKVRPGSDQFISEKYAEQIEDILARWTSGLLRSPEDLQSIEASLAPDFSGSALVPSESKLARTGSLEVRENKFGAATLSRDAFIQQLRSAFKDFSKLLTAELQLTAIDASSPALLKTRIRYEIVASGRDFHREQRVGQWDVEWRSDSSGQFQVGKWEAGPQTQARSAAPIFVDIGADALGKSPSYSAQLAHGADYWRTVLDGACGIDIYGHNGVSVGDIDGDGFDSLYVCQPAGLPNRLYRNRGDGTFEDITDAAGLGVLENTACALFADINNDGRQDLIVVRSNGPLLFLNEGGRKFRPTPGAFQFANPPQGTFTGAAIADYDRDGWLDIYFCLYIYYQGTDQYKYPLPYYAAENGPPNFMMRNNRDGTFHDVTAQTKLNINNTRYSFCCGWNDYNGDGWPDLYVVNDFGRKDLYRNNGDGTFTDVAGEAGVQDVGAGMGVCWFDYDNDGREDLYVADMWTAAGERISSQAAFQKDAPESVRELYHKHAMGNSAFRNTGNRSFQDVTARAGTRVGRWAWSTDAWDFDHDGFADLYIVNGMISSPSREELNSFFWRQVVANSPIEAKPSHDYEQGWSAINELIRADVTWSGYERNVFYANNGDGTFSDVSGAVGLDFIEDGRSFALADFDHDGRVEVFLKNRSGPQVRVLKNAMTELPPSVAFRLKGTKSNPDAIGAVVTVETSKGKLTRCIQAGSGFLSQHSKELFFGLGDAAGPVRATIRWPSGTVQEIGEVPANHRIWLEEGSKPSRIEPFQGPVLNAQSISGLQPEVLPESAETWLLAPVTAPGFSFADSAGRAGNLKSFRGTPLLLTFSSTKTPTWRDELEKMNTLQRESAGRLQLLTVDVTDDVKPRHYRAPAITASADTSAIYNILFRNLFDRHRDLPLPCSFLIDEKGNIVKVYQGPLSTDSVSRDVREIPRTSADRIAKALPFRGTLESTEFTRNYLSYGSVYYQRGYFEEAESSFRRALAEESMSAEALYGLGSALLQQGKNAEAREDFERAVNLPPSYPDTLPNTWNNLGLIATREGKTEQAINYFQQALHVNPDHLVALVNLGNAFRQLKEWDAARAPLERAVRLSPDDPEANYSLAMVFAQTDDSNQAYDYLQRALETRPNYPEALNNLGILYLRTGRRDEAVASFEKCIQTNPGFDQAYLNLARVYAIEGSTDKARSILQDLLTQHPGHKQAQATLDQIGK